MKHKVLIKKGTLRKYLQLCLNLNDMMMSACHGKDTSNMYRCRCNQFSYSMVDCSRN